MNPIRDGARVAVIGAGPGGLTAAKHALEAGYDVSVFEASDDLGGQWNSIAPASGIWPGMRTNTSRAMTAFSDHPVPATFDLYPRAEEIHAYLRSYADRFGVTEHIRFGTTVTSLRPAWEVDGESFDAVVVASGRFRAPLVPRGLDEFGGHLVHAFDYLGAEQLAGHRVLVYGNGVSGHEVASDIASVTPMVHAYRKPRYVLQKQVEGVPSDWQWYTHIGALRRAAMPPAAYGQMLRERILRVAGNPVDFGAPAPDPDLLVAGHSLCQDYLRQVRAGTITPRPAIASLAGQQVTFVDGTSQHVDTIVCATGYRLDLPFLSAELWARLGPDLRLHRRTLHPDLPGIGFVGQFALQGPYLPLLELQARWIVGVWSGVAPPIDEQESRAETAASPPPIDAHNVLALAFSQAAGVSPDLAARPGLTEALLFGPMLPPRYRLDGQGSDPAAEAWFAHQLATSPRPVVPPEDVSAVEGLGLGNLSVNPPGAAADPRAQPR